MEPASSPKTTGLAKTDSAKPGKKRNARTEDANLSKVTPLPVAEPQKQILPLALAVAQPQENATPDQSAKSGEKATPDENSSEPLPQTAQVAPSSLPPTRELTDLRQPTALKPSVKFRQTIAALPNQLPGANVVPSAAPDSSAPQALRPSSSTLVPDVSVREKATASEAPSSPDQVTASAKAGASPDNQPVSRTELNLPAAPAEPVAATPVPETADSAPSTPLALAFAARMAVAPQKPNQPVAPNPVTASSVAPSSVAATSPVAASPVAANAAQIPTVPGSETPTQIPVRYAATAQIIHSSAAGTKQDEPKKEASAAVDQSFRADAHTDIRTDMVTPRYETVSQPSPASASAAPQQAAPSARMESVIEPPAAPPTSTHDIRVRVPDNNGGSTQVRFVESGGEVRVSVRTADEGLAQNLRTHLNDLTQRLSDGGMPAEIWKPVANAASSQNDSASVSTRTVVGRADKGPAAKADNRTASRNGLPGSRKWKLRCTPNRIREQRRKHSMTIQGQNPVTAPTAMTNQAASSTRRTPPLPIQPPPWPMKIRSCNCWWPRSRIRIRPTPPIPSSSSRNWRNSANSSN